jgi:hypothetical protein
MHHEVSTPVEPPEMVLSWIAQLLDPDFIAMLRACPYDRVDIRLSSSKGRVSRVPTVVFNGGAQEFQN